MQLQTTYALMQFANEYDQYHGYTLCLFDSKPTASDIATACDLVTAPGDCSLPPCNAESLNMLANGETVVHPRFGDYWVIEEIPTLRN